MRHFVIYEHTLVYLALYHKRSVQPEGTLVLTKEEYNKYFDLVINKIEEEKNIANLFTYEIVSEGEPEYNLNLANEQYHDLLKTTTFIHDKANNCFKTTSSKKALSLKSTFAYPQPLAHTIRPSGYLEALNIANKPSEKKDNEPNK